MTSNITNTSSNGDDDKIDENDDDSKLPPQMQTPNPQVLLLEVMSIINTYMD